MARKAVTVSMTFETTFEVDEDLFLEALAEMQRTPDWVYIMMARGTTEIVERELECAVILNVENADAEENPVK